jgi:hypothetical protein
MEKRIKQRAKRVFLTRKQKRFILKNHRRMTIRQMVDKLKIPTNRVYKFTVRERLQVKKAHGTKNYFFQKGMFNPHERENWII